MSFDSQGGGHWGGQEPKLHVTGIITDTLMNAVPAAGLPAGLAERVGGRAVLGSHAHRAGQAASQLANFVSSIHP